MIIDCISDLHGYLPKLSGGDMLIVAGDITASDKMVQWVAFFDWFKSQDYEKKILIGGNHDGLLERSLSSMQAFEWGIREEDWFDYLQDSGTEYQGLKIWGSPWTPAFYDWHFMKYTSDELRQVWDKIPDDTNILITHGPAYGILDKCRYSSRADNNLHAGCNELLKAVNRIKPGLHVFGHIHESHGHMQLDHLAVNAALMNEEYYPVNKPTRVIYGPKDNNLLNIRFMVENDM